MIFCCARITNDNFSTPPKLQHHRRLLPKYVGTLLPTLPILNSKTKCDYAAELPRSQEKNELMQTSVEENGQQNMLLSGDTKGGED